MKDLCNLSLAFVLAAKTMVHAQTVPFDAENPYQTHTRTFGVGLFPERATPAIRLCIDNYSDRGITVTLKDSGNNVYYMDMLGKRKRRTRIRFDMAGMKDAVYQVVVANGTDRVVKEINLSTVAVPLPVPQLRYQRFVGLR